MSRSIFALAAIAIFFIVILSMVQGSPDGEKVFRREGCPDCHSFRGRGGGSGPDLTSVSAKRSSSWLKTQIRNPRAHDENSRMPAFPHLSEGELRALVKYLKE